MSTSLYYLLSTVAQTLAAAIALLGALMLFRLQGLFVAIDDATRHLIDAWRNNGEELISLHQLRRAGKHHDVMAHFTTGPGKRQPGTDPDYFATLDSLGASFAIRDDLQRRFRMSLGLTVGTILASVIAIPLVPLLTCNGFGTVAAVAAVLGLTGCLATYVGIVKRILVMT